MKPILKLKITLKGKNSKIKFKMWKAEEDLKSQEINRSFVVKSLRNNASWT